jgi:hypothetical protein
MVVTADTVFQGILLSSIFLMAISMPKIIFTTLWSVYRLWLFNKTPNLKIARRIASEGEINRYELPETQRDLIANELKSYPTQVKKPSIEMLSALVLMGIGWWNLEVDQSASSLLMILMFGMIIVGLLMVAFFGYNFLRWKNLQGSNLILP